MQHSSIVRHSGQLHTLAADGAGRAEFIIAERRRGRLEARGDFNGGIHPDGNGNRQRLAGSLGFFGKTPVPPAGHEIHGNLVTALQTKAVDGDIGFPRLRSEA
jgi:hypothetical protein